MGTRKALSQLILKIGLVTVEGQHNHVLYQTLRLGQVSKYLGNVGQPNSIVALIHGMNKRQTKIIPSIECHFMIIVY